MNVKAILCPIDFSEHSRNALAYASTLARESGAELHLVHIYEPPIAYTDPHDGFIPPADLRPQMELLDEVQPTDDSVAFRHEFIVGHAPDALLDYADKHGVDLIVMGTHGRTGITRLLMGSVAEAIVRKAKCPVLTIRHKRSKDGDDNPQTPHTRRDRTENASPQ